MIQKLKNIKPISAFSLVELAMVLLIASILISGGLTVSRTAVNNAKNKVTKDRIDIIYKTLTSFLDTNKRLPCPALIQTAKTTTSTYGDEAATPGACTSAFTSTSATNLAYGMVPIKALNLPAEMAEDGFGNKFDYVVDKRFTFKTDDTNPAGGFEDQQGVPHIATTPTPLDIIKIKNSATTLTDLALFAIISHGANGYKAWKAEGTTQNTAASPLDDENDNSRDEGTDNNFNNQFVASSTNSNFDDIVLYKTKQQLILDARMEFIKCSKSDGNVTYPNAAYGDCVVPGTTTTSATVSYGVEADVTCPGTCSGLSPIKKTCGKNGVWGSWSEGCSIGPAPPITVGYSLRKIRAAYNGSAIRVRKSSGGEQDIGFAGNGDLDTAALSTFVGTDDGFVTKWYDQSGDGYDAVQTTASSQPKIVSSGTIETMSGSSRPTVNFTASPQHLKTVSAPTFSTPNSFFTVSQLNSLPGNYQVMFDGRTASNRTLIFKDVVGGTWASFAGGQINGTTANTNKNIHSAIFNGASSYLFLNNSQIASGNTGTNSFVPITIGIYPDGVLYPWVGKISEIRFYNSDMGLFRSQVNDEMNSYYSIY